MVQWVRLHASTAGGTGSIPGQETKIPHASQTKNKKTCSQLNEKARQVKSPNYMQLEREKKKVVKENNQKTAFELAPKAKPKMSRARPVERREAGWVNHQE